MLLLGWTDGTSLERMYNLLIPNNRYQAKSNESFEKGSRLLAVFSQEFLSGILGKLAQKRPKRTSPLGQIWGNQAQYIDIAIKDKLAKELMNQNNLMIMERKREGIYALLHLRFRPWKLLLRDGRGLVRLCWRVGDQSWFFHKSKLGTCKQSFKRAKTRLW